MTLCLSISVMGQQKIQLRSADKVECVKSDMTSLRATFSFSSLDANNIETTRGELSEIYIEGSYPNGNVGEPQLPMFTRLIAIPTGATPIVSVGSHSETQYKLSDYGIGTVAAMQAPIRKNVDPSTVEYAFDETAYARNSYNDDPIAMVEVLGTMRGITLGRLIVQPVRYNPAAGTVKVFNDIEVNVNFENGDAESTERMFKSTANVAFQSVYDQIFNIDMLMGATRDAYTDHPDFYNTPVKMLVICYSGFQGNSALESWLQWKLQKGYYVDIYYTSETGTTASAIASFIKTKYNASVSAGNAYTYLVVIGDTGQVPQYMTKTVDESCASDLGYSSVNFSSSTSNYFPDMYYSRMSVENTTHLTNYINKVLTYEKFEFTDGGNYLNNVILVGGWDSSWTSRVAKPTINYATNYYFKSSNTTYGGFENGTISATISTSSTQGYSGTNNGCYNGINNGVCFLNYTAHGDKQEWYQPKMTAAQVATLTNTGKYFFGVGNCCLTGNFNNTSTTYSPGSAIGTNACFAETMIRVPNAGAVAYVGCSPYSYWYEDFYWAVGAHSYSQGNYPSQSASSKGVYDVMFEDQYWNSASALLYVGNLAVQQAVTNGNTNSSVTDGNCNNSAHYYFQFYHTFGDGSVMPYITKPEANTVTIPSTVTPGTTSITVNAVAGSYVAVTDNSSVIYGVAEANSSGVATVNFTNAIPSTGTLYVVVTRQQYQPYFGTITVQGGTQYSVTATASPSAGGSVSGSGTYYENTECTLTATANTGYTFTSWEKGGTVVSTDSSYTFTVSSGTAGSYTATFTAIPQYTISVSANPSAGGTVSGGGTFYEGSSCTLTATANTHYEFASWTKNGTQVSTSPTYTFTVTSGGSYTASFTALQQHTVTCAAVENGSISASPTTAYKNETVTLTATAASGYYFSSWDVRDANSNAVTVSGNQFTMPDSDVTVSATFVSGCTVTVAEVEHGTVAASTTGGVPGITVTLTATPDAGCYLSRWLVFKTGDVRTTVEVTNNQFALPAYDVTVVGVFKMTQEAEVAIGSGGSASSYLPTYAYYNYSLTQQIFTASEIGNAGTITAVAFKVGNNKSTTRSIDVYLSHTSKSSFSGTSDWVSQSTSYRVYSGSVTFASSGWTTITLNTPFEYDGSSNLLLTVDDNTGSYVSSSSNSPQFYVYSTSGYTSIYKYNDGTNYNPASMSASGTRLQQNNQVTFTMTTGDSDAMLAVTPNAMDGFSYVEGHGPSEVKSVAVIGVDLSEAVTVTAPEHYEVSDSESGTYGASLTLDASGRGVRGVRETLTYDFEDGVQGWTVLQGATGNSPNNWHHNTTHVSYSSGTAHDWSSFGHNSSSGFMMSESYISATSSGGTAYGAVTPDNYLISPQVQLGGSVSFYAGARNTSYCAEQFSVMVSTTGNTSTDSFTTVETWVLSLSEVGYTTEPYTVDLSAYAGQTGYVAIRHWGCTDQWVLCIDDITIVEGDGGSGPVNPTDPTTDFLTANVYVRLKGGLGQGVYNETLTVATGGITGNVALTGEVTGNGASTVEQAVTLSAGWNYWSTYLDITVDELKSALQSALPSGPITIKSQGGGVLTYSGTQWRGSITAIDVSQMYEISVSADCVITLSGAVVDPAEHPVSIVNGSNWMGFPVSGSESLAEAFAGFTPSNGDVIKDQYKSATYYNGSWYGNLDALEPGHGYIYQSRATTSKTFTFPSTNQ